MLLYLNQYIIYIYIFKLPLLPPFPRIRNKQLPRQQKCLHRVNRGNIALAVILEDARGCWCWEAGPQLTRFLRGGGVTCFNILQASAASIHHSVGHVVSWCFKSLSCFTVLCNILFVFSLVTTSQLLTAGLPSCQDRLQKPLGTKWPGWPVTCEVNVIVHWC